MTLGARSGLMTIPSLSLLLLAACQGSPSGEPPAGSKPAPSRDDPVACEADADCPSLGCGPCRSGEVVTQWYRGVSCNKNPCVDVIGRSALGRTGVCRNHICVVP